MTSTVKNYKLNILFGIFNIMNISESQSDYNPNNNYQSNRTRRNFNNNQAPYPQYNRQDSHQNYSQQQQPQQPYYSSRPTEHSGDYQNQNYPQQANSTYYQSTPAQTPPQNVVYPNNYYNPNPNHPQQGQPQYYYPIPAQAQQLPAHQPINIVVNANPVVNANSNAVNNSNQAQNNSQIQNDNNGEYTGSGRQKEYRSGHNYKKHTTLADRLRKLRYVIVDGEKYYIFNRDFAAALFPVKIVITSESHAHGNKYSVHASSVTRKEDENESKRLKTTKIIDAIVMSVRTKNYQWNLNNYESQIALMESLGHPSNAVLWINMLALSCLGLLTYFKIDEIADIAAQPSMDNHSSKNILKNKSGTDEEERKTVAGMTAYLLSNLISSGLTIYFYPNKSFYEGGIGLYGYWFLACTPAVASGISYWHTMKDFEKLDKSSEKKEDSTKDTSKSPNREYGEIILVAFNITSLICFIYYYNKLKNIPTAYNQIMSQVKELKILVDYYDKAQGDTENYIANSKVNSAEALFISSI